MCVFYLWSRKSNAPQLLLFDDQCVDYGERKCGKALKSLSFDEN